MSDTYRILVTGTRNGLNEQQVDTIREYLDRALVSSGRREAVVVHGGCPTGVDALVHADMRNLPVATEVHPADWKAHGRGAGPIRNRAMVDLGADICLAFPRGDSRGTRGCAALAQAAGIPTTVVEL